MNRFAFTFVFLVLIGTETGLLQNMCSSGWISLPWTALVVTSIWFSVDLWHLIYQPMQSRKVWISTDTDYAFLARFVLRWLVCSVPPMLVLLGVHHFAPTLMDKVTSGYQAWKIAMSILVWHGFLSLGPIRSGRQGFCLAYFFTWFNESFVQNRPFGTSNAGR